MTGSATDNRNGLHLVMVCTGNICRSPMAEAMLTAQLTELGLDEQVTVSSAGTGGWHQGHGMDERAAAVLSARGIDTAHSARRVTEADHDADLVIALDRGHRQHLLDQGIPEERVRLLRSFDPDASSPDVDDPYYGDDTEFDRVAVEIDRALPGVIDWIRERLSQ